MRIAATLLGCLWVVDAHAQVRFDRQTGRRTTPEAKCPFAAPRLDSGEPAEVAWAAHKFARRTGEPSAIAANELRDALRAMCAGESEAHRRAVSFLLHAAWLRDAVIPLDELQLEPERDARVWWVALQVRAAQADGAGIFALFQQLDAKSDPAWEYVGGALAIRAHPAFAIEMRTRLSPKLRVNAGRRPADTDRSAASESVLPNDFPELPRCIWNRDKFGLVGPSSSSDVAGNLAPAVPDERRRGTAQLRWLAQLTGEPDPVAWAARFDAQYPASDMTQFEAFAQQAELRARDALAAADAALRRRFKLPERLVLPDLEVVFEDHRREAAKKAQPMAERK